MLIDVLVGTLIIGIGAGAVWVSVKQTTFNLARINTSLETARAVENARVWLKYPIDKQIFPLELTANRQLIALEITHRMGHSLAYRLVLQTPSDQRLSRTVWVLD